MNRRYKKYTFDDKELYIDGLDKEDMDLFYRKLPEDAKIVRWGQDFNRATTFFIVEHESFEEIDINRMPEEVMVSFTEEWKKESAQSFHEDLITKSIENSYSELYKKMHEDSMLYGTSFGKIEVIPDESLGEGNFKLVAKALPPHTDNLHSFQYAINEQMSKIKKCQDEMAVPRIFVDKEAHNSSPTFKALEEDCKNGVYKLTCNHEWKKYEGIMCNYDFCVKCDEKRT